MKFQLLFCLVLASTAYAAPAASGSPAVSGSLAAPSPAADSAPAISVAPASKAPTSAVSGSPVAHSSSVVPASSTESFPPESATVAPASSFPNFPTWSQDTTEIPEAVNDGLGASIMGPENVALDQQNPDFLAPPTTDAGSIQNAKWPFSFSHNRLQTGGWARQQNLDVFPIATAMASVNMRLEAGSIRELHWHKTDEWAFVLSGNTKVTAVNADGQVFVDTVGPGDLWYFPAGIPHSLQATDDNPDGSEFLLVFDDGDFSEDDTFLLTDWMSHVPMEVLSKNFGTDISAFAHIPSHELYIFPGSPPAANEAAPSSPAGTVPNPFTFKLSQVKETPLAGGSIKVVDTRTFPVATNIVGSVVTVEPGAIRELHWHPTQPEWSYYLQGEARMSIFGAQSNARTFDFRAGDIGYVPPSFGHFVENTGNTTVQFLEIFNANLVQDISLQQWLALTPPELVKAHLGFDDTTIAHLNKTKQTVAAPFNPM